jgi:DNA-binding transcriptional LysR family regulator
VKAEVELRHLRVFAAVVEHGTHTRAAKALGMSQSTVSETLAALERSLGVVLWRKSKLTPAGEIVLAHAHRMFGLTSELVTALADASTEVKATLTIAAVESVSAYVLPPHLAALRARWPAVRVEVVSASCPEIRDRVASGLSDVGLVLEMDGEGNGEGEVIARPRLLVLGAAGHPLAGRLASDDELRRCDFHMCDAGGSYHQALRQHFEAAHVPAPRMQAMGTIEGTKQGILGDGTALGVLPEHAAVRELRERVLAEVRLSPPLPTLAMRAVLGEDAARSPVVSDLLESLRPRPARAG